MQRYYSVGTIAVFSIGLLVLPVIFGSASGSAALLLSLIWLPAAFGQLNKHKNVPPMFVIWFSTGIGFFLLFIAGDMSWTSAKFGLNTFAFLVAVSIFFMFTTVHRNFQFFLILVPALTGLLVGAIWAIYQYDFVGTKRVAAFLGGGPNLVARIALLQALFAMAALSVGMTRWAALFAYVFVNITACLIVVYSGSRGALLAVPIVLLAPLLFSLPKKYLQSYQVWLIILLCVIGVLGLFFWVDPNGLVTSMLDRVQSVLYNEGMDRSTATRYKMWQVAFQSFLENPFIGTGWHSFVEQADGTVLEHYAARGHYFNFHSDIANFAVAGGTVGLLFYFLLLFTPLLFWDTPKEHPYFRVRLYWAVTMPVLYLVLGLTDMVMGFDYPTMFYAFSFAIIWGLTEQTPRTDIEDGVQASANETYRS